MPTHMYAIRFGRFPLHKFLLHHPVPSSSCSLFPLCPARGVSRVGVLGVSCEGKRKFGMVTYLDASS